MLISFIEIIYLLLVTLVVGYIFSGAVPGIMYGRKFDLKRYWFACLVAAPGIVFHELSHKFVAIFFGLKATFEIWGFGLVLGAFLKAIGSSFILFAPGYVIITGTMTHAQEFFVAFAGPIINLILWLGSWFLLDRLKLSRNQTIGLYLMKQINMWLFIFNMLPIPPLDGSKIFYSLFNMIF